MDLNEAEEIVRQLRESQPELYERIRELRGGIRCGRVTGQKGTFVFCRAGRYRQLFWLDENGEILSREIPRILSWLRCDPETPAAPLPPDHNQRVMAVKERFEAEVEARRAERQHTVSLTRAQRYVLKELQLLYKAAEGTDTQRQIDELSAAFRRTIPRPAVRAELNKIRNEKLTGEALLDQVSRVYHVYGLDVAPASHEQAEDANDRLARVVCSEGVL